MRSSGPAVAVLALLLMLLPVLYVLSIGPAVWLHDRGLMSNGLDEIAEVVYAPLDWAADASPLIEDPLDFYIELWEE